MLQEIYLEIEVTLEYDTGEWLVLAYLLYFII